MSDICMLGSPGGRDRLGVVLDIGSKIRSGQIPMWAAARFARGDRDLTMKPSDVSVFRRVEVQLGVTAADLILRLENAGFVVHESIKNVVTRYPDMFRVCPWISADLIVGTGLGWWLPRMRGSIQRADLESHASALGLHTMADVTAFFTALELRFLYRSQPDSEVLWFQNPGGSGGIPRLWAKDGIKHIGMTSSVPSTMRAECGCVFLP